MAISRKICETHDCEHYAEKAIAWTEGWQYFCNYHMEGVAGMCRMMNWHGHLATIRPMSKFEMFPGQEKAALSVRIHMALLEKGITVTPDQIEKYVKKFSYDDLALIHDLLVRLLSHTDGEDNSTMDV